VDKRFFKWSRKAQKKIRPNRAFISNWEERYEP
jgi:hypothetical protein